MFGAISSIARSDAAPPGVVIVGVGFGGLWAAKTLANAPVKVGVIDRENYQTHLSISPNTISREPMIAEMSASMCPRDKKFMACRCAKDGARILHL
jgi:choline dehydrogenase-like flavoprotein